MYIYSGHMGGTFPLLHVRSLSTRLDYTNSLTPIYNLSFMACSHHCLEALLILMKSAKTILPHSHPLLHSQALSCPDYPVTNYSAVLILPDGIPQRLGPFLPTGSNPETITITSAHGLMEDRMYNASVEARNQFGTTFSEARTICK